MRDFEHDPSLAELLDPKAISQLSTLLSSLADSELQLESSAGSGPATPVELNLDTIGWITGDNPEPRRRAAASLVEVVLHYVYKYRLAANLHRSTTEASFQALERQNEALRQSETRYRELAESLQDRVDSQVEVIRQAQQELYESARLRAVGYLAAGVAHEINNPIGFIKSNLKVANEYVDELEEALPEQHTCQDTLADFRALLEESLAGSTRIASIVADLKAFSSIDQGEYVSCNINQLLTTAMHLVQTSHPDAPEMTTTLSDLPDIPGHAARLSQALFNVLDNAAKAVEDGGTIAVQTRHTNADTIRIEVTDTGCGIDAQSLDHIFDPFFTTRQVGSGTGLGLTVARETITAHQGSIDITSDPGQGTRVVIELPAKRK
ncbi:two-component sensor histidine kinase [Marinobacter halodurans]|uniref:histidine kinase n=1 Tax=Marinobacter halodurans TaxID=2528979 RepID=A0ABY1ZF39_9GAMM|nr:ATP-binding protein [Marinobacter halodurans]TBW49233.1 two-component sensor histidine kinase [Marinobacter halodurans]